MAHRLDRCAAHRAVLVHRVHQHRHAAAALRLKPRLGDSRDCDLVNQGVVDVFAAGQAKEGASVLQPKARRPVKFENVEATRASLKCWADSPEMLG